MSKYRVRQRLIHGSSRFFSLIPIALSAVPSWYVFTLLFSNPGSLPGADPAQHILISRWIAASRSILVPYSAFLLEDPKLGYYPAVWQGGIAAFHSFTGINELDLIRSFVFSVFLLGTFSYWLVSEQVSDGELVKGTFVYFVLLVSIAPIIKSVRDGIYGEILGMWFFFPLFLLFFLRHRMLRSVVTLTSIIAVHNLSAIMAAASFLSFLLIYLLEKDWQKVKFALRVLLLTAVLSSPSLYYNYYLTSFNVMVDPQRFSIFPFSAYPSLLTDLTLYAGIVSLVILFIFYRKLRWLPLWFGIYVILANALFGSERFVREMSVPLSLSIGIVFYDLVRTATRGVRLTLATDRSVKAYNIPKNLKLRLLILLLTSLVIAHNGIQAIASESAPVVTDYFTPVKAEAYSWLNHHKENMLSTLVIRCLDSWARVYVNGYVYEAVAPGEQSDLSIPDRVLNNQLTNALLKPFSFEAFLTFREYNISHFILSPPLPRRWYSSGTLSFIATLLGIHYEAIPFYKLVYERESANEAIKIYEVVCPSSPEVLLTIPSLKDNCILLKNNVGEEVMRIPFWETDLIFGSGEEFRLFGHLIEESMFDSWTVDSEVLFDSISRTTTVFKDESHEFTHEVLVRASGDSAIYSLIASTDVPNLKTIGIGFTPNSIDYTILTPDGGSIKYDARTNKNIEVQGFEVIKLDNNVTVIIYATSRIEFENLFEWNVIRPKLEPNQTLSVIVLSDSEAFVADSRVYVRYGDLVKPVEQIIEKLLP